MHAAVKGHDQAVAMLLDNGAALGATDRKGQTAFELARTAKRLAVARLLVAAGADYQPEYDHAHGEGQRCPICFRDILAGAGNYCSHWVCTKEGPEYSWFRSVDFNDEVRELTERAGSLEPDERASVEENAPDEVGELITRAGEYGSDYVVHEPGVVKVRWDTEGMLSGAGVDLFHPESGFGGRVKREAAAALRWLRSNFGDRDGASHPPSIVVKSVSSRHVAVWNDDLDNDGECDDDNGACPFCKATDGCSHLLAFIDVTFAEIGGGTFFDLKDQAVEGMDEAVKAFLKAEQAGQAMPDLQLYRLAQLVKEVRSEIGGNLDDENLRGPCYNSFLDYLGDLLYSIPGVIETCSEFDEGGPRGSSSNRAYWVKYAKRVAKAALRQIEKEAEILKRLSTQNSQAAAT